VPRKGDCRPVLDRIRKRIVVNEFSHCWIWHGALIAQGKYPGIAITRSEVEYVHRVLYKDVNGSLPEGSSRDGSRWELHHGCGNKRCVNPAHLRLMTHNSHVREEKRLRELVRSARKR